MLTTSSIYKTSVAQLSRATDANIYFGIYDVTAKGDSNPVASNSQPFAPTSGIKDNIRTPLFNVATFEDDLFLLDSSFNLMPDDASVTDLLGWWSLAQSLADRSFTTNPTLTITFTSTHSSLGLGLFFDPSNGETCDSFNVTWWNGSTQLATASITGNTATSYNIIQSVSNYNKIVITFTKTSNPYRYIKLMEVNFGLETAFNNNDITAATITEELDPISNTITINTLSFTVLNTDQKFNMTNPSGVYAYLQQNQQIVASSKLLLPNGNYESIALGTYYLSEWKNATGLTATLTATDAIGLLDKTTYDTSPFWVNATITAVVSHILNDAGSYPFVIDSSALSEIVNGYIPVMSHREALQDLMVACRCALRINRDGVIHITKMDYATVLNAITYDTVLGTPTIEQKTLITSVIVTEYSYVLNTTPITLATSTFTLNGTNTMVIDYDSDKMPATGVSLTVSGAGVLVGIPTFSATSATVTITGTGSVTVTITGQAYTTSTRTITAANTVQAGQVAQSATVTDNTLICGDGKGLAVANNILTYYGHRIKQSFDYWDNPAMQAGDNVSVQNMFGATSNGVVEHQEITFSPNLKARVEVVG